MPEKFVWNLQYSVHSDEIDDQHKRFFEIINELYDLLDKKPIELEPFLILITHLGDYAFYHFATEEGYFKIFNYAHAEEHILQHDIFRTKSTEFLERARYQKKNLEPLTEEVAEFAKTWLKHHILLEDVRYMPMLRKHGVK
ncbi:hypothetical protein A3A67_04735 [Candidatus Peribacteria bacterium RIFCSPLOWO2_01_FULL_51_18]|nr:MAG: hypothetical protein A3C52_01945 [Candidatus Peribacteria bacterium RIFCSPHIGHO2_02_FULL_51_15]OGJ66710.1 MAG: hypothetical protein A3A67_04735 [Candidatus Peribacteria bacterium RIFCSPLOWO2_01_FULL_51_18]OGJ69643.1 MAG: hypothetical protein A3J34_00390 [Candidatus Peribacteria bacterium RIFCSPLOWO2_02_FULL_51_10]